MEEKKEMKFDIIHNEQTPAVPPIKDVAKFIEENYSLLSGFRNYAAGLTYMNPIGLAANQCSLNGERIMKRFFAKKDLTTGMWSMVINPIITERSGDLREKEEGCLTWGTDKIVVADRYFVVKVEYYDIEGEKHSVEAKDFEAQIWQHEINHLDGIEEVLKPNKPQWSSEKFDRNGPCPCGSGKKYKKCCLKF